MDLRPSWHSVAVVVDAIDGEAAGTELNDAGPEVTAVPFSLQVMWTVEG